MCRWAKSDLPYFLSFRFLNVYLTIQTVCNIRILLKGKTGLNNSKQYNISTGVLFENIQFRMVFLSLPSTYISGHTNKPLQFYSFTVYVSSLAFSAKERTQTEGSWE